MPIPAVFQKRGKILCVSVLLALLTGTLAYVALELGESPSPMARAKPAPPAVLSQPPQVEVPDHSREYLRQFLSPDYKWPSDRPRASVGRPGSTPPPAPTEAAPPARPEASPPPGSAAPKYPTMGSPSRPSYDVDPVARPVPPLPMSCPPPPACPTVTIPEARLPGVQEGWSSDERPTWSNASAVVSVVVLMEGPRRDALGLCLRSLDDGFRRAGVAYELIVTGAPGAGLAELSRYDAVRHMTKRSRGCTRATIVREEAESTVAALNAGAALGRAPLLLFVSERMELRPESSVFLSRFRNSSTAFALDPFWARLGVFGALVLYDDDRVYHVGVEYMLSGFPAAQAPAGPGAPDPAAGQPNVVMPYLPYRGLSRRHGKVSERVGSSVEEAARTGLGPLVAVPCVSMLGMMVPSSLWARVGGFHPGLATYYAAADFVQRLQDVEPGLPVHLGVPYTYTLYASATFESWHEFDDESPDAVSYATWHGRAPSRLAQWAQRRAPGLGDSAVLVWSTECGHNFELGFTTEAFYYVLGLLDRLTVRVEAHEWRKCRDAISRVFPAYVLQIMHRLTRISVVQPELMELPLIVVVHRVPTRYWYALNEPRGRPADYLVGRSMFETDRIGSDWVYILNGAQIDEVWVPSMFNVETFVSSGVHASKVRVLHESLDVHAFYGSEDEDDRLPLSSRPGDFVFLSVMKWEPRKCWDCLLAAYARAFTEKDNVTLVVRTNIAQETREKVLEMGLEALRAANRSVDSMPRVEFLRVNLPLDKLPALYSAADVLVQPSHGEGWGRPLFEALAVGTPVMATRWSGQLEFLTDENAYLVPIAGLVDVGPQRPGHHWAQVDIDALSAAMRRAYSLQDEAREKGARGREDIHQHFSVEAVSSVLETRLREIALEISNRPPPSQKYDSFPSSKYSTSVSTSSGSSDGSSSSLSTSSILVSPSTDSKESNIPPVDDPSE